MPRRGRVWQSGTDPPAQTTPEIPAAGSDLGSDPVVPGRHTFRHAPDSARSDNTRFQVACRKIQEASRVHLDKINHEQDVVGSDEEVVDDETRTEIIERIVSGCRRGGDVDGILDRLNQALDSESNVCLICIDSIRRTQPIWTCQPCRVSLHLVCVGSWARDRLAQQQLSDDPRVSEPVWNCPNCRFDFGRHQLPIEYTCYCGRLVDPPEDPWLLPHTCGEVCGRSLTPPCSHKCLLRCHPGACAPCPVTVNVSCHCGQSKLQPKRCSKRQWSCQKPCNKLLACQTHRCEQICHTGECQPCTRVREVACQCGALSKLLACTVPQWQCNSVCNAPLACGHHRCSLVCHPGVCPPCPDSGSRTCPCGSTRVQLACTESVPVCGSTCDKLLVCGEHRCHSRCHHGPCDKCLQIRVKRCRCGRREKESVCDKPFLCESKCKREKHCGRHACKRKCCIGDCGQCDQTCNRMLDCGKHRCVAPCHRGRCYPCTRTDTLRCACGATTRHVPCGRRPASGNRAPTLRCRQLCRVASKCHHPVRQPHPCHHPPCPPCKQVCGLQLDGCTHSCQKPCHDQVEQLVTEQPLASARTPCERGQLLQRAKRLIVREPCPPCQVIVWVACLGGHCTIDMPCSQAISRSCGAPCGRVLACANHTCTRECHTVTEHKQLSSSNVINDKSSQTVNGCDQCQLPCQAARATGCKHRCPLGSCHPPPCPPCRQHRRMACHCRLNWLYVRCSEASEAADLSEDGLNQLLTCKNPCHKQLECGHRCPQVCHPGVCVPPEGGCQARCRISCPCGRRNGSVLCCEQQLQQQLVCDQKCAQKKEQLEKEREVSALAAVTEAEERRQREIEEAERFLAGTRRRGAKSRRRRASASDSNATKSYRWLILPSCVVVLFVAMVTVWLFVY